MSFLLSVQSLTKSFGPRPLFRDISFGIDEGERLGLIGPNGAGKSTLLKIISGQEKPDKGNVSSRRGVRIGFVSQSDRFPEGATINSVLMGALAESTLDHHEREFEVMMLLARLQFPDEDHAVASLSGGWQKRVSIARELIKEPDILILDEPTNHLDLQGIIWLEELLREAPFAVAVVTHDRYFLENVTNRIVELNKQYADGFLSIKGNYSRFLEEKENYLAGQVHQQDALESIVKREVEWLRRNPQARTTKADYRIREAHKLIGDLAEVKYRNNLGNAAGIDFSGSGRKTRELYVGRGIGKSMGGKQLFSDLDLTLTPQTRLGLLGPNGSGKTTLLRILMGELKADKGDTVEADSLRRVYFDQKRAPLDPTVSLRRALCPDGDNLLYQGQSMHVAAWAKRLLFPVDQLEMPIKNLSGGEQARVLMAQMMLSPADILILDEPTNDLDIPSLEILEESMRDFPGAVVLVTHDRYLLDRVSTEILALDGKGGHRYVSDYSQWEALQADAINQFTEQDEIGSIPESKPVDKPKLNSAERKELLNMETTIHGAEQEVDRLEKLMLFPSVSSDPVALGKTWNEVIVAKEKVAAMYARWEELEQRR